MGVGSVFLKGVGAVKFVLLEVRERFCLVFGDYVEEFVELGLGSQFLDLGSCEIYGFRWISRRF